MSWWQRITGGSSERAGSSRTTDYLAEAIDLEARGDFANALTSYRLALRQRPDDPKVLLNIAIAFSKTSQPEEAIRSYRRALELQPALSGAHYGLAYLLLKRSDSAGCAAHLEAFLRTTRRDGESARFVAHAERTLASLSGEATSVDDAATTASDATRWAQPAERVAPDAGVRRENAGPTEPGPGR